MVAAASITTYATLELITESPGGRIRVHPAVGGDTGSGHVSVAKRRTPRQIDGWEITISRATPGELYHLETVWQRTSRGALPLLAEPPEGGGAVPCVFTDPTRPYPLRSATAAVVTVGLRRFHG